MSKENNSNKAAKNSSSPPAEFPRPAPEQPSTVADLSVNDCIESLLRQLADATGARDRWERRARAFQDGYRDKSFEVTALEIQLMDLRAHGVDKVTARNNQSLKDKMLAVCVERNELRERVKELEAALSSATINVPE